MNLIDLSIRRPIFITMVTLFLIVAGILAARELPIDLYPDVNSPVIRVRTMLEGASPQEVEELISKPIEDALSTIGGVQTMRSVSREGQSFVLLEFEPGRDIKFDEIQVREKAAEAQRGLPEEAEAPVVSRQNLDDEPIFELALTGKRSVSELSWIAEHDVAKKIRQVEGVGDVNLVGRLEREVRIELKPEALFKLGLNASEVVAKLRQAVSQEPAGKIEGENRLWLLRMLPAATKAYHLSDLVVGTTTGGLPVSLGEIAYIKDGFKRRDNKNIFNTGAASTPSVTIEITRQSGQNTLAVASGIKAALSSVKDSLPQDIELTVTGDASRLVMTNMLDVAETLAIAAILTVFVVLLFLQSPRSTITTAVSLPSSVLTTFLVMKAAGFTINTMTLLALTLAIGIIVDDAIVVRENIFRHLSTLGKNGRRAASEGTKEVAVAVIATTLTLVAVFVPIAGLQSVTGQFFKPFALTVVFAVLVSTWDALTMAPLLSAHFANIPNTIDEWRQFGRAGLAIHRWLMMIEHAFDWLTRLYTKLLAKLLGWHVLQVVALLLSLTAVIVGALAVRKGFLPTQLGSDFRISLSGPLSVPPEKTFALMPEVERRLTDLGVFEFFSMNAGSGWSGDARISLTVRVKPELSKSQASLGEVRSQVRKALSDIPGFRVRVREVSDPLAGGGGRFSPVVVTVRGEDLDELDQLAKEVRKQLDATAGITDISDLSEEGLSEFRVKIDEAKAGIYGIPPRLVADNLKIWIQGQTAMYLKEGDTQVPVIVALADGQFTAPNDLLRYPLFMSQRSQEAGIPLAAFASVESSAGPTTITREDRQRTLRVFAGIEPTYALGDVLPILDANLKNIVLGEGSSWRVSGQGADMNKFFYELIFALLLGALFVYMVLASLFEHLTHPITVLLSIPLAGSGAFLALWALDIPLDLYGGIGLVLLSGLVAKNGILLVDMALATRRASPHLTAAQAMLQTAPQRLRPIVMTSLAMVVGMLPIATGWGVGGATRQSLGLATIGGVMSSTLLSLMIIPSVFIWIDKLTGLVRRNKAQG